MRGHAKDTRTDAISIDEHKKDVFVDVRNEMVVRDRSASQIPLYVCNRSFNKNEPKFLEHRYAGAYTLAGSTLVPQIVWWCVIKTFGCYISRKGRDQPFVYMSRLGLNLENVKYFELLAEHALICRLIPDYRTSGAVQTTVFS